jgi:hypothetical protein
MATRTHRSGARSFGLVVIAIVVVLTAASCAPDQSTNHKIRAWQDQVAAAWKKQLAQFAGSTTTTPSTGTTATTTPTAAPPTKTPPAGTPAGGQVTPTAPTIPTPTGAPSLKVSGAKLVDASGTTVQLRGVNRSGLEYRCVNDFVAGNTWPPGFISDDPNTTEGTTAAYVDTVAHSLLAWNKAGATTNAINTVRVPLNEDCWLGINGTPAAYSGANYQAFVNQLVADLEAQGMYVVLDLHWSAAGTTVPTQQDVAPDADHSIDFWRSVAADFKSSPGVSFDLFNEPRVWCNTGSGCPAANTTYPAEAAWAWGLYRDGGNYTYTSADHIPARVGQTFKVAGTQQLVDAIRAQGANNVIFVEGLGYGNALDLWGTYAPKDSAGQLAASQHQYQSSGSNVTGTAGMNATLASDGIAAHYPLLIGEFGESICPTSSNPGFAQNTMAWADSHGYSYTAWAWDQGEGCGGPSLVTSNDTGATTAYGAVVKAHLQSLEH